MGEKRDSVKDVVVGAVGAGAALMSAPAVAATAMGSLAAVTFERVAGFSRRRAERLLNEMIEGDAEPESFAARLHEKVEANDDKTLTAFRMLLIGAIESPCPESVTAMSFIGRAYFSNRCLLRHARASVDLLKELDREELGNIKRLLVESTKLHDSAPDRIAIVTNLAARTTGFPNWYAVSVGGVPSNDAPIPITRFEEPYVLFAQMKRSGAGSERTSSGAEPSPHEVEIERTLATLLRDALIAALAV